MRKLCLLLSLALLLVLPVSAEEAFLEVTYRQCDDAWKDIPVGDLTIAESACGIATVCNAVYYLTGERMDLVAVANWAHEAGLFNAPGVPGCYRSVFYHASQEYGSAYGFAATQYKSGSIRTQALIDHLLAGGTAALHVPGHFMAAVDYNPETEKFLIIDPMPGDYGRYDNRRKGITHSTGDWLTAEELSAGYVKVDGYALHPRALGKRDPNLRGHGGKGIPCRPAQIIIRRTCVCPECLQTCSRKRFFTILSRSAPSPTARGTCARSQTTCAFLPRYTSWSGSVMKQTT